MDICKTFFLVVVNMLRGISELLNILWDNHLDGYQKSVFTWIVYFLPKGILLSNQTGSSKKAHKHIRRAALKRLRRKKGTGKCILFIYLFACLFMFLKDFTYSFSERG